MRTRRHIRLRSPTFLRQAYSLASHDAHEGRFPHHWPLIHYAPLANGRTHPQNRPVPTDSNFFTSKNTMFLTLFHFHCIILFRIKIKGSTPLYFTNPSPRMVFCSPLEQLFPPLTSSVVSDNCPMQEIRHVSFIKRRFTLSFKPGARYFIRQRSDR